MLNFLVPLFQHRCLQISIYHDNGFALLLLPLLLGLWKTLLLVQVHLTLGFVHLLTCIYNHINQYRLFFCLCLVLVKEHLFHLHLLHQCQCLGLLILFQAFPYEVVGRGQNDLPHIKRCVLIIMLGH